MQPLLSGPSSVPPQTTHALICLHGFGSNGDDLITLAAPLRASLGKLGETLAVFSPNGLTSMHESGYQWFSDAGWTFRDASGLTRAAAALESYLAHISEAHNIPRTHMALLGFSQGAMTSLYALPSLTTPPAALISCSGGLTIQPTISPTTPTTTLMLFLHGLEDDVWPADNTVAAEAFFRNHGYPTTLELIEDLAHGINPEELAHISVFLQSAFTE